MQPLTNVLKKNKQLIACVMLLGMLVAGGHLPPPIESLLFYLVVFGVALIAYARNTLLNVLLALSFVLYLAAWHRAFHDIAFNIMFCASGLICLIYGITSTVRFVLTSKEVSKQEVLALINCYLSLGYFFSLLYALVEGFSPGAFSIPMKNERVIDSLVYFSFTTMTTLGYGDVLPHSTLAQRLAVAQAVVGQFYFALVVAYLLNRLYQEKREPTEE